MITNADLLNNKYDETELVKNLGHLNKKRILNTQILSEEFCAKHIFCMGDDDGDEDSYWFDFTHIMNTQPHLNEELLIKYIRFYHYSSLIK
jgi:hypothetical protein